MPRKTALLAVPQSIQHRIRKMARDECRTMQSITLRLLTDALDRERKARP